MLQTPEFKVNHPLLNVTDETGMFQCCLWKSPGHTTKSDFQGKVNTTLRLFNIHPLTERFIPTPLSLSVEFIDDFCEGTSTNKVYEVEGSIGMQNLDERSMFRDWILACQGKDRAGFLDKPMMRMVHHHINDKEGWEERMMQGACLCCSTTEIALFGTLTRLLHAYSTPRVWQLRPASARLHLMP